ncbi:MAG: hypothetical protein A3F67_07950 [Verrucomicrobia bacterium RIFCSPHIGHO2_12_FULL_41_10]|nr:MAG: hypothetical protein A3F67_07950 [Verrucomicrobia bacterium RIFCSPHIGHO2_12_FULL_41_10]HLB33795.1 ComF family protein [Chthoniobacterales bacterium]
MVHLPVTRYSLLITYLHALLELFYPLHCAGCGCYLLGKKSLCEECWDKAKPLSDYICSICSHQLNIPQEDFTCCENCGDRNLHFVAGVSAFRHDGLVSQLLYQFKYGGDQSLKKVMGEFIDVALNEERLQGVLFSAVVPVPLYRLREREREFNQARLIAEEVAGRLLCPVENLLQRVKPTSMQALSDRKQRIQNLKGAFAIKSHQLLSGNYLLVDDVLTTGSTLDECAKVLLQAGASKVWAVTVARG